MPENTVSVTRPGPWGNQYRVVKDDHFWWCMTDREHGLIFATELGARRQAVRMYCEDMSAEMVAAAREQLRGKNLACFCRPPPEGVSDGIWCHAAQLLAIANA